MLNHLSDFDCHSQLQQTSTGKLMGDFYQAWYFNEWVISLSLLKLSFKLFSANKYKASTGGERLFIAHDLELINAISISEITPTLTLFKRSINIESLLFHYFS